MINDAQVVLSGYVAREPQFRITSNGNPTATLRVGYTPRRMDRDTGEWTDGATSFVTVVCWRTLAHNVATCVRKGEPVLVRGRLQVRPYEKEGVSRLAVEVEASSVGHDLARGVAMFQRSRRAAGETALSRGGSGVADGNGLAAGGGQASGPGQADGGSGGPRGDEFFAEEAVASLAAGGLPPGPAGGSPLGAGGGPAAAGGEPDDDREDGDGPGEGGPDGAEQPTGLAVPF